MLLHGLLEATFLVQPQAAVWRVLQQHGHHEDGAALSDAGLLLKGAWAGAQQRAGIWAFEQAWRHQDQLQSLQAGPAALPCLDLWQVFVHPNLWAGAELSQQLRQPSYEAERLRLACDHDVGLCQGCAAGGS